jgi:hypothetical protein
MTRLRYRSFINQLDGTRIFFPFSPLKTLSRRVSTCFAIDRGQMVNGLLDRDTFENFLVVPTKKKGDSKIHDRMDVDLYPDVVVWGGWNNRKRRVDFGFSIVRIVRFATCAFTSDIRVARKSLIAKEQE